MSSILLVEDNQQHADRVIPILERSGFNMNHALKEFKSAQVAREECLSLILMDFEFPNVALISRKQLGSNVPPIVAGHASEQYRQESKATDCSAFLAKPYVPEDLLAMVRQW